MYQIDPFMPSPSAQSDLETLYELHTAIVHRYGQIHRHTDLESFKTDFIPTLNGDTKKLSVLSKGNVPYGILTKTQAFDWSGAPQLHLNIAFASDIEKDDATLMDCLAIWIDGHGKGHGNVALIHYNNELEALSARYDGQKCLHADYLTLDYGVVDPFTLEAACKDYASHNPDLTITYHSGITEDTIEEYCSLFMETQEDMPDTNEPAFIRYPLTVEKQRQNIESNRKSGIVHHGFMIRNGEGDLVGMTNVRTSDIDPRFPYQFMIGVKRAYRGRHLGKWMYGEMYRHLKATNPFEKVLVCHHPDNRSAITLSEWVGYEHAYLESLVVLKID